MVTHTDSLRSVTANAFDLISGMYVLLQLDRFSMFAPSTFEDVWLTAGVCVCLCVCDAAFSGCADLHLLDMLSPMERKRQGYIHELIVTEENYVNDLQLVTEVNTRGLLHPPDFIWVSISKHVSVCKVYLDMRGAWAVGCTYQRDVAHSWNIRRPAQGVILCNTACAQDIILWLFSVITMTFISGICAIVDKQQQKSQ